MKVAVLTLGCKANQAESSTIEERLRARGCEVVGLEEGPHYCIINTCTVTAKSDYQSRQLIRRASRAGSRVIVTGCYAELNKDFVQTLDGVYDVVGIAKKESIPDKIAPDMSECTLHFGTSSRSRLFLKVQDGCNGSCSYCIIPTARGRARSVPARAVIEQISKASQVYREVVLTGIHLGTYGYDLEPKVTLAALLDSILKKTAIRRVRLSSLEIGEITGELLDLLRDDRVCNHLHIPLQSGDDRILGLMNRKYSASEYRDCIMEISQRLPGIALGTDVIAGFPGEGDFEFSNTLSLLESLPFSYLHVFPFSPRSGTRAVEMPGRVGSATVKERCALLRALGRRKNGEYLNAQVGRTLEVLVEEFDPERGTLGTTRNYLKVRASAECGKPKDIVPVRIAGVDDSVLVAHPIEV